MRNVWSLGNKTDKLVAVVRTQREFHECSLLSFTETLLHLHTLDHSMVVPGFLTEQTGILLRVMRRRGVG